MPNSAECGCRFGIALSLRAGLSGQEPPECPRHAGASPVEHDAVEYPSGTAPIALNDDARLTAAISKAFGVPVNRVTDL